jgi:alpha-glucosidase
MDFGKGAYLRQHIQCARTSSGDLLITFEPRQGRYRPWWKQIEVIVHDRPTSSRVSSRSVRIQNSPDPEPGSLNFLIADVPNGGLVTISG